MFKSLYLIATILFSVLYFPTLWAKTRYLKLDSELSIYLEETGHGKQTILFVPGWSMSSKVFEHQLDYFKNSKKYKVIAIDPRGQGLSSKTSTGHSYKQRGMDLASIIDVLKLKNLVLVGWSFGTLDVLSYVSQFGLDKLKAVMILDGSPKTMSKSLKGSWSWIDEKDSSTARRSTTLGVLGKRELVYKTFVKWMLSDPSEAKVQKISEMAYQTPAFIAALTNETASYCDYESTLIKLSKKRPVYIFVRDEWQSVVESWIKKNKVNVKFSHMGKHLMFWEQHSKFNEQLSRFLESL